MQQIIERLKLFSDQAYRNIVKVTKDFSDVSDDKVELEAIDLVLGLVGKTKTMDPKEEFHYTAAIGYPFETDHYAASRFCDGSFSVWYGSIESETTIYETAYHMLIDENAVEHAPDDNIIYRDRIIYTAFCKSILIDVTGKEKQFPDLISNNYHFTQNLGKQIQEQGLPGILSPSARYTGTNLNIFKESVLSNPKPQTQLSYALNLETSEIVVEIDGQKKNLSIKFCEIM